MEVHQIGAPSATQAKEESSSVRAGVTSRSRRHRRKRRRRGEEIIGRRRKRAAWIRAPPKNNEDCLKQAVKVSCITSTDDDDVNSVTEADIVLQSVQQHEGDCDQCLVMMALLFQECGFLWNFFDALESAEDEEKGQTDEESDDEATEDELLVNAAVAVEATAISSLDLDAVDEEEEEKLSYPFVCGSNFVGIVHYCGEEAEDYGIELGSRVAAIVKWGSNTKYVSIPPEHLWVVPKSLDASDIACLISSYLPAFEALHHGRARPYRYSRSCLKGRRVLVTGGGTVEAQALVRLAKYAGAEVVYVTCPKSHRSLVSKSHAVPLSQNPEEWLEDLKGRMDIIVDYGFPRSFTSVRRALSEQGRLVCVHKSHVGGVASVVDRYQLSTIPRATLFDFEMYVRKYRDELRQDLNFLLSLLEKRQIRPTIDRFIALRDIPATQEAMKSKPLTGTIVCEPWKAKMAV